MLKSSDFPVCVTLFREIPFLGLMLGKFSGLLLISRVLTLFGLLDQPCTLLCRACHTPTSDTSRETKLVLRDSQNSSRV